MERGVHGRERFRPKVVSGDVSNRAVFPAQAGAKLKQFIIHGKIALKKGILIKLFSDEVESFIWSKMQFGSVSDLKSVFS
jgi:hypothetical protein